MHSHRIKDNCLNISLTIDDNNTTHITIDLNKTEDLKALCGEVCKKYNLENKLKIKLEKKIKKIIFQDFPCQIKKFNKITQRLYYESIEREKIKLDFLQNLKEEKENEILNTLTFTPDINKNSNLMYKKNYTKIEDKLYNEHKKISEKKNLQKLIFDLNSNEEKNLFEKKKKILREIKKQKIKNLYLNTESEKDDKIINNQKIKNNFIDSNLKIYNTIQEKISNIEYENKNNTENWRNTRDSVGKIKPNDFVPKIFNEKKFDLINIKENNSTENNINSQQTSIALDGNKQIQSEITFSDDSCYNLKSTESHKPRYELSKKLENNNYNLNAFSSKNLLNKFSDFPPPKKNENYLLTSVKQKKFNESNNLIKKNYSSTQNLKNFLPPKSQNLNTNNIDFIPKTPAFIRNIDSLMESTGRGRRNSTLKNIDLLPSGYSQKNFSNILGKNYYTNKYKILNSNSITRNPNKKLSFDPITFQNKNNNLINPPEISSVNQFVLNSNDILYRNTDTTVSENFLGKLNSKNFHLEKNNISWNFYTLR